MTTGLTDQTKYEQLCTDFRALNAILWQMPVIFTTLTGGLWFSVASLELTNHARTLILEFAALANLIMIAALIRLRIVMERQRRGIARLDQRDSPGLNFFTVGMMSLLLLLVAGGSWTASRDPTAWFAKAALKPAAAQGPAAPPPGAPMATPAVTPASQQADPAQTADHRRHG